MKNYPFTLMLFLLLFSFKCFAIEIYSHRGAAGLAPENTLKAIETAVRLGVNVIDVDIGITKDRVVVAYHDLKLNPDLTRVGSDQWLPEDGPAIKDIPYNQLKQYNVGKLNPECDVCRQRYPLQKPEEVAAIPTLKEVINLIKTSDPSLRLQIEIKTNPSLNQVSAEPEIIVPALVKVLKEQNFAEQVEVHSFDWRNLLILQRLAPEVTTSYLSHHQDLVNEPNFSTWLAHHDITSLNTSYPQLIKQLGGKIWCPHYQELSLSLLQEAHQLGLRVNVWTVDKPNDMLKMIEMGVDGIITNRPDLLRGLLAAHDKLIS